MPVDRADSEKGQKRSPMGHLGPKLEVATATFSRGVVLQIVDDCVVPALVEAFLRTRINLPAFLGREHNGDQP